MYEYFLNSGIGDLNREKNLIPLHFLFLSNSKNVLKNIKLFNVHERRVVDGTKGHIENQRSDEKYNCFLKDLFDLFPVCIELNCRPPIWVDIIPGRVARSII